jgi:hypothetical protein
VARAEKGGGRKMSRGKELEIHSGSWSDKMFMFKLLSMFMFHEHENIKWTL